jgi:type IV pilus assembly protein PilQ
VLGDLPYVGFLFKNNIKSDERRELLIFITPRIIKEGVGMRP